MVCDAGSSVPDSTGRCFIRSPASSGFTVDVDLDTMQPNQTLAGLTASSMQKIDGWLETRPSRPGPGAGRYHYGLCCRSRLLLSTHPDRPRGGRTADSYILTPFPEELNRRLASRIASLHFAPTRSAQAALLREGVADRDIEVTGNTVVDALFMELSRQAESGLRAAIEASLAAAIAPDWATRPFVLITGHRRESFGEGFEQICRAIRTLALRYPEYRFVYPVHLNPNVQRPVKRLLDGIANIALISPQGYRNFVALMNRCKLILTDSGGVQEEAPSLGKPVLVMRETTERPEGVEAGTALLVGAVEKRIVENTVRLLDDASAYEAMANAVNPYGDGHAAERIVARIERFLGLDSSIALGQACSSAS